MELSFFFFEETHFCFEKIKGTNKNTKLKIHLNNHSKKLTPSSLVSDAWNF